MAFKTITISCTAEYHQFNCLMTLFNLSLYTVPASQRFCLCRIEQSVTPVDVLLNQLLPPFIQAPATVRIINTDYHSPSLSLPTQAQQGLSLAI